MFPGGWGNRTSVFRFISMSSDKHQCVLLTKKQKLTQKNTEFMGNIKNAPQEHFEFEEIQTLKTLKP